MISRRRVLIPALLLCALSLCAFGAAHASAAELTSVECNTVGGFGGNYSSGWCETPATSGSYETVANPLNTPRLVFGYAVGGTALRATLGGSKVTIKCETLGTNGGLVTNKEPSAGKHTIEGTATRLTFSGCRAVLAANEARFCSVVETSEAGGLGMLSTNALKGTTTGVEHKVKVSPAAGEVVAAFTILNKAKGGVECPFAANVAIEVKGSIEGEASTTNHKHLTFTEANNGTALKANGGTATFVATTGDDFVGAQTFT